MTRNLNWADAGRECQSLHEYAHLLVINNAEEQKAVAGWLDSVDSQCSCFLSSLLLEFSPTIRSAKRFSDFRFFKWFKKSF